MKKITLALVIVLFNCLSIAAQKKSELFAEIEDLKSKLDTTETALNQLKRSEKASVAKAESLESQVLELQAANATLLKNLNNFAEVSNKNSENINKTLASLDEKEKQLKVIKDAISKNDSTAIVVLTDAKQTLGENSKIGVSKGAVTISSAIASLLEGDKNSVVSASGKAWLEKIAAILTKNPDLHITVEGLSNTGELDIALIQATTIANTLQNQFTIDPNRISAMGKDGGFSDGIHFKLHPDFNQFYATAREHMKNGNK